MSDPDSNIERATNGLVLALFVVAALFLGVMLFYVLRDIQARQSEASSGTQAPRSVPTQIALERPVAASSASPVRLASPTA